MKAKLMKIMLARLSILTLPTYDMYICNACQLYNPITLNDADKYIVVLLPIKTCRELEYNVQMWKKQ